MPRDRPAWIGRPCVIGYIVTTRSALTVWYRAKPPGAAPKLSEAQTTELRGLVLAGPDPKTDKVVR